MKKKSLILFVTIATSCCVNAMRTTNQDLSDNNHKKTIRFGENKPNTSYIIPKAAQAKIETLALTYGLKKKLT